MNMQPFEDALQILKRPIGSDDFTLIVKRYFTTIDGDIQAKAAALPVLQTRFPVFLFGHVDSESGYPNALAENPTRPGTFFIRSFVKGTGYDSLQFSGFSDISKITRPGDLIFQFADDPEAPNEFVFVVISISNKSYNNVLQGLDYTTRKLREFSIFTDQIRQWSQSIAVLESDEFDNVVTNQIEPLAMRNAYTVSNIETVIPYSKKINRFFGMATYIDYETERLDFVFRFEKKESKYYSKDV